MDKLLPVSIPFSVGTGSFVVNKLLASYLSQWSWKEKEGQVCRQTTCRNRNNRRVSLTSQILGYLDLKYPEGTSIQHINRDSRDARLENMRFATKSQQNAYSRPHNDTGFKGVNPHQKGGFEAKIGHNGKRIYLGLYKTATDAAHAYDFEAFRIYGEFAYLNFPDRYAISHHTLLDLLSPERLSFIMNGEGDICSTPAFKPGAPSREVPAVIGKHR